VYPNANDVTAVDGVDVEWLERFIDNVRRPVRGRRGCAEHKEPARCNHTNTE
jgi:hypothetical protein